MALIPPVLSLSVARVRQSPGGILPWTEKLRAARRSRCRQQRGPVSGLRTRSEPQPQGQDGRAFRSTARPAYVGGCIAPSWGSSVLACSALPCPACRCGEAKRSGAMGERRASPSLPLLRYRYRPAIYLRGHPSRVTLVASGREGKQRDPIEAAMVDAGP